MMSRRKTNRMFSKPLATILLATPLLASACADQGPWPMPTGYTYDHAQYQNHPGPPGPEPVFKKWEHEHGMADQGVAPISTQLSDTPAPTDISTTTTTATTTATTDMSGMNAAPASGSWDQAAHELVSRLVADFGRPTEAVWLQSDGASTDQSLQFEKALLAALQQADFHLASGPGAGPFTLQYSVKADGSRSMLTITLMSAGHKAAEETGAYTITGGNASSDAMPMPASPMEPPASPPDAATTSATSAPMTAPDAAAPPPPDADAMSATVPPPMAPAADKPVRLTAPEDHGGGYNQ